MDKDNFARLLRAAAEQYVSERASARENDLRHAFLAGVNFVTSIRADNSIDRLEIFKTAKAALAGIDDDTSNCLELCESLEKIMRLCTTPAGEGGLMNDT